MLCVQFEMALRSADESAVVRCLKQGIDPKTALADGRHPIAWLFQVDAGSALLEGKRIAILKKLVRSGARLAELDSDGNTALHLAAALSPEIFKVCVNLSTSVRVYVCGRALLCAVF